MKNTIKTGVLSFGMSGKIFHAPFLKEHCGFELTAVVERTKKKAYLTYPAIKSYNSVTELLADNKIELVVINTPNATHFEFALKAIQAKKHVLVEKPFTVTSAQAKKLFQEANKNDCCILPYQNRRYDSDFMSVKSIIESGRLGDLVEAHFRYDRYQYRIGSSVWKETAIAGSGIQYNLGSHLLDGVISLFGIPLKWSKNVEHFRPNTQIDDYAHIHLVYPNGLQVFVSTSLLVADSQPAFVLHGTRGSYIKNRTDIQEKQLQQGMKPDDPLYGIELPENKGILTTISNNGIKKQEKIASVKSSYLNVFDDVYQTIREGKPYPVTEKQIMQQLEILEV